MLNIHNNQDVLDFIAAQLNYFEKREQIRSHWNNLFTESHHYYNGIALVDKDSEERKKRMQKVKEYHQLMQKEELRIKPELDALNSEIQKWFPNTSDIDDCIQLGEFISAYSCRYEENSPEKDLCFEAIQTMLESDATLYDNYVKWQGDDEYIKEFSNKENQLRLQ